MEASRFGFMTSVRTCPNGDCSQAICVNDMKTQGEALYGLDAYGPGGTLIDTERPFNVRIEIMTRDRYRYAWGIKTRLTQNGREILMASECSDWGVLNTQLDGGSGLVFASWDNRDERETSIETVNKCTNYAHSCTYAMAQFSEIQFQQYDYNKEKSEDPEKDAFNAYTDPHAENGTIGPAPDPVIPDNLNPPLPVPATWESFTADLRGSYPTLHVKGLDDRTLTTATTQLEMG